MKKAEIRRYTLLDLSLPVKALFTGYLLAIGLGLCIAGMQIFLSYGMTDGRAGISVDDIIYGYHGNASASASSKLVDKLNGSMRHAAPPEVRMTLLKWIDAGAPASEWEVRVKPMIVQYCSPCHENVPGLSNLADKVQMDELTKQADSQLGSVITNVPHVHLFGISFIFLFVGWIFTYAIGFSPVAKAILIMTPFGYLILDAICWWLTLLDPNFAWLVIIGGVCYSAASAVMILTSLYQLWFMKKPSPE